MRRSPRCPRMDPPRQAASTVHALKEVRDDLSCSSSRTRPSVWRDCFETRMLHAGSGSGGRNFRLKTGLWTSIKNSKGMPRFPPIPPLRNYHRLMDPPTEQWPVFLTFNQPALGAPVWSDFVDCGTRMGSIAERRDEYTHDLLLMLEDGIRPLSITTDGAQTVLQQLTDAPSVNIDQPKHNCFFPMVIGVEWGTRVGIRIYRRFPVSRQLWRDGLRPLLAH